MPGDDAHHDAALTFFFHALSILGYLHDRVELSAPLFRRAEQILRRTDLLANQLLDELEQRPQRLSYVERSDTVVLATVEVLEHEIHSLAWRIPPDLGVYYLTVSVVADIMKLLRAFGHLPMRQNNCLPAYLSTADLDEVSRGLEHEAMFVEQRADLGESQVAALRILRATVSEKIRLLWQEELSFFLEHLWRTP